jgi:hypothetical protein
VSQPAQLGGAQPGSQAQVTAAPPSTTLQAPWPPQVVDVQVVSIAQVPPASW